MVRCSTKVARPTWFTTPPCFRFPVFLVSITQISELVVSDPGELPALLSAQESESKDEGFTGDESPGGMEGNLPLERAFSDFSSHFINVRPDCLIEEASCGTCEFYSVDFCARTAGRVGLQDCF